MLTAAVLSALMLQQAAAGQAVWTPPAEPAPVVASAPAPALPDWARADPFGYERSECSPLIRSSSETMEACQGRVRATLAANLGDDLPAALRTGGGAENCRQEAAGDRYALQCGAPARAELPGGPDLADRNCMTRPNVSGRGAVLFSETCTRGGRETREEGLKVTFGGRD